MLGKCAAFILPSDGADDFFAAQNQKIKRLLTRHQWMLGKRAAFSSIIRWG
jgi:hypothetical protein